MDVNEASEELHKIFNKRFFNNVIKDINQFPPNAIYVLFEEGEFCNEYKRIVYVGKNSGKNSFPNRILDHFIRFDHRKSIIRKNIGRCLIRDERKDYLIIWNKEIKDIYQQLDLLFELEIEKKINEYLQEKISFNYIPIESSEKRTILEKVIIATIHQDTISYPSIDWLGRKNPRLKKLWNTKYLKNTTITEEQLRELNND